MGLFATKETIRLFINEDKITEEEVSREFIEVLSALPYKYQLEYSKEMSKSIVYGKKDSVQLKPEAFDVDKKLLLKVIVSLTAYDDDGELITLDQKDINMGTINDLNSKVITSLVEYLKKRYGLTAEAKEEVDELGE